jgi:hypothetical protein
MKFRNKKTGEEQETKNFTGTREEFINQKTHNQ